MKIDQTTQDDGLMAASLLQILAVSERLFDALKLAGLPVTGPGLENRQKAQQWFINLTKQMAAQLQPPQTAAPPGPSSPSGFRVKSIRPIGSSVPKPSRKKK